MLTQKLLRLIPFVLADQLVLAKLNELLLSILNRVKHPFLFALNIKAHFLSVVFDIYPLAESFELPVDEDARLNHPLTIEIIQNAYSLVMITQLKSKVVFPIRCRMLAMLNNRQVQFKSRICEEGFGCVSHKMGEYLRLQAEHVRSSLAQSYALFSESVDGNSSVVGAHLPPMSLIVVLIPHACYLCIFQSADLQLMTIVSQSYPLQGACLEETIYHRSITVDDQTQAMRLVVFEEAYVSLKVLGEKDPKTVPLIGLVDFSLVNTINKVGSSQLRFLRSLNRLIS